MDNVIVHDFLSTAVTTERYNDYNKAFGLMEDYDYKDIYSDMIGAILNIDVSTMDAVLETIDKKTHSILNYILKEQYITLNSDTPLDHKLDILRALYDIQHLDLYETLAKIAYSSDDVEEVLSMIVEELTGLDYTDVMIDIEIVDGRLLPYLRIFIDSRLVSYIDSNMETIERLKIFFKVVGDDNLAKILLDHNLALNSELAAYLTYIDGVATNTLHKMTINIMGMILYSGVSYSDLLSVFRSNSETLIGDLSTITKVDIEMSKIMGEITIYQEAVTLSERVI